MVQCSKNSRFYFNGLNGGSIIVTLLVHLLTCIACLASVFGTFFNINFFAIIPQATYFLLGRFTKGVDHFPLHCTF